MRSSAIPCRAGGQDRPWREALYGEHRQDRDFARPKFPAMVVLKMRDRAWNLGNDAQPMGVEGEAVGRSVRLRGNLIVIGGRRVGRSGDPAEESGSQSFCRGNRYTGLGDFLGSTADRMVRLPARETCDGSTPLATRLHSVDAQDDSRLLDR